MIQEMQLKMLRTIEKRFINYRIYFEMNRGEIDEVK